ncbi:hypothetical protein DPV73_02950 [Leptospira mayottensis]|nr:hypothetical protein DPV73_02950 [Leptospira mayottensis]
MFLLTLHNKTRNLRIITSKVFYSDNFIHHKLKKKPFDSLNFGIDCKSLSKIKKRKRTSVFFVFGFLLLSLRLRFTGKF